VVRLLEQAAGGPLPPLAAQALAPYVGEYASDEPQDLKVAAGGGFLWLSTPGRGALRWFAMGGAWESGVNTVRFREQGGRVTGLTWSSPYRTSYFCEVVPSQLDPGHRWAPRDCPRQTAVSLIAEPPSFRLATLRYMRFLAAIWSRSISNF
jgi:hypothetical protein